MKMKKRSKLISVTALFLAIQSVAWYYLIEMTFFVFTYDIKPPKFYLLPGIDTIIKAYFPLYYHAPQVFYAMPSLAYSNEYSAASAFLMLFQLGLIISIIISIAFYVPWTATSFKSNSKLNGRKGKLM